MIGATRKRDLDSIQSTNGRRGVKDDENPWFRDPDQEKRDSKIRRGEHSPNRLKESYNRSSRSSEREQGQIDLDDRDNTTGRSPGYNHFRNRSRQDEPRGSQRSVRGIHSKPTHAHLDDAFEDGEIAEGLDYSEQPPASPPPPSKPDSNREREREKRPNRDSGRGGGRGLERDGDRSRDREKSSFRDRDTSRERGRDRDHYRERDRERDWERERDRERERERGGRRNYESSRSSHSHHHSGRRASPGSYNRQREEHRDSRSSRREDRPRREHRPLSPDSNAKSNKNSGQESSAKHTAEAEEVEAEEATETTPKLTEEEILEQARRKRAAILAKHKKLSQIVNQPNVSTMTTDRESPALCASLSNTDRPGDSASSPVSHGTAPAGKTNPSLVNSDSTPKAPLIDIAERNNLGTDTPQVTKGSSEQCSESIPGSPEPVTESNAFDLTQDPTNQQEALGLTEGDESTAIKHPLDQPIVTGLGHQSISAADYNPDDDRRIDNERQVMVQMAAELGASNKKRGSIATESGVKNDNNVVVEEEEEEEEEEEDDDDMFAIDTPKKKKKKSSATNNSKSASNAAVPFLPVINRAGADAEVVDNFDDADGYYRVILGELLDNGRYHVHANLGKGMFASVVRAKDMSANSAKDAPNGAGHDVAIKVVRSQESMFKAGQKEATILRKLQEADPTSKYHIIRLERTFEHRGHLCLVFEAMSMNLREVVKRFGKDVGINLRAVRAYAHQIFLALSLMKKCNIMHADLKPDNILVSESKSVLKVCDLGSASDVTENEITPYLVSRFYRAPEIILGLPYDCSIDIWSIGCTLYELYTGKILFPGRSNNHLLLLIMELKGRFNSKLLKKARFSNVHFDDENGNFLSVEKNRITGADVIKSINIPNKPIQGLQNRLMPHHVTKKMQDSDAKLLSAFVDLLEKILTLEPSKRITPKEALNHPFIRGT